MPMASNDWKDFKKTLVAWLTVVSVLGLLDIDQVFEI